jgi:hypothetical protein
MSTFVVTLANFFPGVRIDGNPWTTAIIEEGALETGPFAAIDTQALTPVDANPEAPQARSFTTTHATREAGWYRIRFGDAAGHSQVTGAIYSPVQGQLTGAGSPTRASARNAVRHQIRDGMPRGDSQPVPFNMVRLEPLTDQIPAEQATPTQTVFQVRYDLVPTQGRMTVHPVPGTLVCFVDGSWTPTAPTVDLDENGNFTLAAPPLKSLLVTYAWQYLSDGEIDNFVEESRRWLREFATLEAIPDGLIGALVRYASALAIKALERSANIANMKAGDTSVDFSKLAENYNKLAGNLEARAEKDREQFYSRGPEPLEPFVDAGALTIDGYEPLR